MRVKKRPITLDKIKEVLEPLDFDLWYTKALVSKVRHEVLGEYQVTLFDIRTAAKECCKWWLIVPHGRTPKARLLSVEQWAKIKREINTHRKLLEGRTLDQTVAILNAVSRVRVNRYQLLGLTSDYRTWVD